MFNQLIIDGNFWQVCFWFFAYCFLGWIWESAYRTWRLRRIVNSGFLVGPYIPIYGVGGLFYILLLHFTTRPVELFFLGAVIACILEYLTSYAMERIFHARWWDYSEDFGNINGRVTLKAAFAFGLAAVAVPYVQPFVGGLAASIATPWLEIIVITLIFIMAGDLYSTVRDLAKLNKTLKKYQKEIDHHTASFFDIVRKNRHRYQMHMNGGKANDLTYVQRRTIWTWPGFDSTKYPEALQRLIHFYARVNQRFRDAQYRPIIKAEKKAEKKEKKAVKKAARAAKKTARSNTTAAKKRNLSKKRRRTKSTADDIAKK